MSKKELIAKLQMTLRKSDAQDAKALARLITKVELADERFLQILEGKYEALKKSEAPKTEGADTKKVK
jgi:putative protein kinase ArgK-like GTPase of G3E family